MKQDHLAMLEPILAEPDDVARRLVYADWLREPGRTATQQNYGEFIQLQNEYADQIAADPGHPTSTDNGHLGYADDELPKCPVCRARVKLTRHLKETVRHYHWELEWQTGDVTERHQVRGGGNNLVGMFSATWVRGLKERLELPRAVWVNEEWRGWWGLGPAGFVYDPLRRVTFLDAYPACRQCPRVHWSVLSDRDQDDPNVRGRPGGWQPNVLPREVWEELPAQVVGPDYYNRGWYPPWGSPEFDGWPGPHAPQVLVNKMVAWAQEEASAAAIKVLRRLGEARRAEEERADGGGEENSDYGG